MPKEAKKTAGKILHQQIDEAVKQIKKPSPGLFISGLAAGLDISFSLMLMLTMITILGADIQTLHGRVLVSLMYSVGFILVILGRSELFTEHTALAVMPLLDREITIAELLRSWSIIWFSNLIGVAMFSWATARLAQGINAVSFSSLNVLALELLHPSWGILFFSAILAGWLMGLLSWTVTASRDTVSQIIMVIIITFTIGFLQLHHSIIGSGEILLGVFSDPSITFMDFFIFLFLATLGNIIGGAVMVASIKYNQVIVSEEKRKIKQ